MKEPNMSLDELAEPSALLDQWLFNVELECRPETLSAIEEVAIGGAVLKMADLLAVLRYASGIEAALRPFVEGATHTQVFLRSREKMHPAGQELYQEDVDRAKAALSALGGRSQGGEDDHN